MMDAGARVIHVDVMDGHFVPPISIGDLIVDALRDQVHEAGGLARRAPDGRAPRAPGRRLRRRGRRLDHRALWRPRRTSTTRSRPCATRAATPGLALNPGTPAGGRGGLADMYDHLLCMTVNPGWGGQPYIESSTSQGRPAARAAAARACRSRWTAASTPRPPGPCAEAGATLFVAGSSVFGERGPARRLPRGGRGRRRGLSLRYVAASALALVVGRLRRRAAG